MGEAAKKIRRAAHSQQRLKAQRPEETDASESAADIPFVEIGDVQNVSASSIVFKKPSQPAWRWRVTAVAITIALATGWIAATQLLVPQPTLIPEWTPQTATPTTAP